MEPTFDISFSVTTSYSLEGLTEADLVKLLRDHHDEVPPADITAGRYHDTVMSAWLEAVGENLSVAALAALAGHPAAEVTEEDVTIDDFTPSDATTEEEDEAWRPNPFLAADQPNRILAQARTEPAEPVAAGTGEWWRL